MKPRIVEAFGKLIDEAILFNVNKPTSWRDGLVATSTISNSVVTLAEGDSLYDMFMAENGVIAKVEDSGYFVSGHMADISMSAKRRGLLDST